MRVTVLTGTPRRHGNACSTTFVILQRSTVVAPLEQRLPEEALHQLHTELLDCLAVFDGFDALRDGCRAERVDHVEQAATGAGLKRVAGHAFDEPPIDLDDIRRQQDQQLQGGAPEADIIEGETDTGVAQHGQTVSQLPAVGKELLLGNLDAQLAVVQLAEGLEQPLGLCVENGGREEVDVKVEFGLGRPGDAGETCFKAVQVGYRENVVG